MKLSSFLALCFVTPMTMIAQFAPLSPQMRGAWQLPSELEPNATLNYFIGTKGEKPAKGWPLYIYLHGSGPRDMEWVTGLRLAHYFNDAPALYFIPQIPQEGQWYRWYQQSKQWAIEKLLNELLATGEVDPDRLYVFGISEGAYGSQRLASFYGDYWAAAGPMAGGEPLKNAPVENCSNLGFSLLTGAQDKGFYRDKLTYYTQQAFDSLQLAHKGQYEHRISLIPERGHQIDYRPTTPWLSAHVRNPYPKDFAWEDFAMDGRHRTGFFNIQVLERSHPSDVEARQMYRFHVENNVVDVQVDDVKYICTERDTIWGIEMKFNREYSPSESGKIRVYFNEELVNLKKPVTLRINGRTVCTRKLKATKEAQEASFNEWKDPRRIFPCYIEASL